MKKAIVFSLLVVGIILPMQAQLYTPSGTIQGSSGSNNVGIGTNSPLSKLEISGNSAVYSDFASYSGTTINNILPNGKQPTLIVNESPSGNLQYAVAGQVTYRGGLSFGKGGPGIYSINPNPAGSTYYGELRFHTTYWNGTDYNNADRMVIKLDGNVGIGTTTPTSKLEVIKSTATNENDIVAKIIRSGGSTGGSSIVRFGYHSTCDFEVNSGYTSTGHRFGSYFDLNISNNHKGGEHGGVNLVTNGTVKMAVRPNGNVGIGTANPDAKLTVNGSIHTKEVKVDLSIPVPDYVFANDYKLKTLPEVEAYIKENSHLPEIPSAAAIEKNGLLLAEMNMNLLKKVEELTLYAIEQQKSIDKLKKENESFKKLEERLNKIEKELEAKK